MISLQRLFRLAQGPLLTCGRAIHTFSFSLTASKDRCAPFYSFSTIKKPTDETTPKHDGSNKDSETQKAKQKTKVLSAQAQRAVWASKIIKMIRQAQPPKNFKDSLVNRLKKVEIDKDLYEFTIQDKYKDEILQMFTQGKQINPIIFNQERFTLAMTNIGQNQQSKLIFYPTTIVSKQVFSIIFEQKPKLICGTFGIGKSISFVLFLELAKYIHKLVFLSKGSWVSSEKRERYEIELEMLMEAGLVKIPPKCWYWSIDRDLKDDEEYMIDLIKAQTQEFCLEGRYKEQLQSTDDFVDLIYFVKGLVPKDIKPIVVYDQINILISFFRKWNYLVDQKNKNKYKKQFDWTTYELQKQNILHPSQICQAFVTNFKRLSAIYILNSSFQVERQLILRSQKNRPISEIEKVHLKLINHGDPPTTHISYGVTLESQSAKMQYSQLFLILLLQKCRQLGVQEKNIESITENFNQKTIEVKSYYRVLFIREFLYPQLTYNPAQLEKIKQMHSLTLLQDLKKHKKKSQIITFLRKLKDYFSRYCLFRREWLLTRFVERPQQQQQQAIRRLVIHCLRKTAKKLRLLKQTGQTTLSFKTQDLNKNLMTYLENDFDVMSFFYQRKGRNSETLLPFKCNQGVIELEWTVKDFLQISQKYNTFERAQNNTLKFFGVSSITADYYDRSSSLGNMLEYYLIKLMQYSKEVVFQVYHNDSEQAGKYLKQALTFERPNSVVQFWALNKQFKMNEKGISLHKNLKIILEEAKEKPKCYFIGIPFIEKIEKKKSIVNFSETSQSIDFIVVKYHDKQDQYEINTFDVTIDKDKILSKAKEAIKLLQKLLKSKQKNTTTKFKITHYIVCPEKECEKELPFSEDVEIKLAAIESIAFSGCNQEEVKEIFNYTRNLIKYTRN